VILKPPLCNNIINILLKSIIFISFFFAKDNDHAIWLLDFANSKSAPSQLHSPSPSHSASGSQSLSMQRTVFFGAWTRISIMQSALVTNKIFHEPG